ncbi:Fc receptor-like protein 5 [Silurus meridionalis]|nr:Fc receptor-like protein 5 [Silurus meridionalis]
MKALFVVVVAALTFEDSGTYWCRAENRGTNTTLLSNPVSISVTADVILQTPARPVKEGQTVTLLCKTSTNFKVFINKDGVTFLDNITITVENVTKAHEGFYKCVNSANVESPESWLSVKATWVWPVCAIIIILLLIPVIFLLVRSLRKRVKLCPRSGTFNTLQEMPRTKQDVTEIQWDLAWMEMTNLLDKPHTVS